MRKNNIPVFRRLILGLAQHLAAALILVFIARLLFHSCFYVDTMNGKKSYYLDPLSQCTTLEESEVFQDLFRTSVQDIIRLAVIRDQMETNGNFDFSKKIDVTAFLSRYGERDRDYGKATVEYELEDLIKWGRYGVEYKDRVMSLSDFVNYYGQVCLVENFALDSGDNLYFKRYYKGQPVRDEANMSPKMLKVKEKMDQYSVGQLEDMAFSYIMGTVKDGISMNREDDGNLTVYINTLTCRYPTVDRRAHLLDSVDNWEDFLLLQNNVKDLVNLLSENYALYQSCSHLYAEGSSNIKYAIRMTSDRGGRKTLSNVSTLTEMDEESLTEYFEEYRRYLIYYPDSLEFMGNTGLDEGDIYEYVKKANYPYPDDVHFWIALDTVYEAKGDAFYYANSVFENVFPYVKMILTGIAVLILLWLGLGLYLTVTAGVTVGREEEPQYYLNFFDRIWTEVFAVLAAVCGYGIYRGYRYLLQIADQYYKGFAELHDRTAGELYLQYGSYALYGFSVSILLGVFWYSFIRRIKVGNFYQDSFAHWFFSGVTGLMGMVLGHQNTVISVLLPYNIFLLLNLFAVIGVYNLKSLLFRALLLAGIIGFDAVVGMMLFKKNAEQSDIIEGINRIRSGESEYKLETGKLHGANRYLADAVNNIGEGIDNAVKTSMKDERLKTDLITNVSHDIKTPLTSIVNYVELLKRQDIREEPARGYIQILENKSQRLKELTDDLVEASKITSGNIELKPEILDMGELLKQTVGEFSEKLEARNLQVVAELGKSPAIVYADSRRMWRIMENLFNNICKYAMEGTRVYAQIKTEEDKVSLLLKNISKAQMNVYADELTERFIRGDSSRSAEGSGLGLFIAKSLTEALGGSFEIRLDADLFKVSLVFSPYVPPAPDKVSPEQETVKKTDAANTADIQRPKSPKRPAKEAENSVLAVDTLGEKE